MLQSASHAQQGQLPYDMIARSLCPSAASVHSGLDFDQVPRTNETNSSLLAGIGASYTRHLPTTLHQAQFTATNQLSHARGDEPCRVPVPSFALQFFANDSESPWNPVRGSKSNEALWMRGLLEASPPQYSRAGSDCARSDLSYATVPFPSVATASLYGRTSPDDECHLELGLGSDVSSQHGLDPQTPILLTTASSACPYPCEFSGCSNFFATKSALSKHMQRHTKPYKCDLPRCPKTDGFSTPNDLIRHKLSVHKADGVKFRCTLGACVNTDKDWPRADNFRSHLKRVHNYHVGRGNDLSEFKKVPLTFFDHDLRSCLSDSLSSQSHISQTDTSLSSEEDWSISSSHCQGMDKIKSFPCAMFSNIQNRLEDHNTTMAEPPPPLARPEPVRPQSRRGELAMPDDKHSRILDLSNQNEHRIASLVVDENDHAENHSWQNDVVRDCDGAPDKSDSPDNEMNSARSPHQPVDDTDARYPGEHDISIGLGSCPNSVQAFFEPETPPSCSGCSNRSQSQSRRDSWMSALAPVSLDDEDSSGSESESAKLWHFVQKLKNKKNRGMLDELKKLLTDNPREPTDLPRAPTPVARNQDNEHKYACNHDGCAKAFKRQCDLKKHTKRHEKPYGCTFAKCERRFGSKNDWKRHETTQHWHVDTWKCEEMKDPTAARSEEKCGRSFSQRPIYKSHLQEAHHVSEERAEQACNSGTVGRNAEAWLWCGFCLECISEESGAARDQRFEHIDEHLGGKGKNDTKKWHISEWKHFDAGSDGSSPLPHRRGSAPKRKRDENADLSSVPDTNRASSSPSRRLGCKSRDSKEGKAIVEWFCCHCGSGGWGIYLVDACLDCNHRRDDSCTVEERTLLD